MIRRAARIIAALGGAADEDVEIVAVVEALRASSVEPRDIADAIVLAFESDLPTEPVQKSRSGVWAPTTALGACFGAVGGALGLRAIAVALLPAASYVWIVPLVAIPLAVFALVAAALEAKAKRADQRERAAVSVGLALRKAGVAPRLALEVGVVVAGLEDDRARPLMNVESERAIAPLLAVRKSGLAIEEMRQRPARRAAPALAAVWAVATFWILYFGTVAATMSKDFGE